MSLIIFRNLVTNKVCTDKECAVLSYIICAGEEVSEASLGMAFPTMRQSSIQGMLIAFYCRGWVDLEKRVPETSADDKALLFVRIDPVMIRRILERCNEGIDYDLGKKVEVIKRIFDQGAEQPQDSHVNTSLQTSAPSSKPGQPKKVMIDGVAVNAALAVPAVAATPVPVSAPAPAVEAVPAPKPRKVFVPPTREQVIKEAAKYIEDRGFDYPQLRTIDPEVCADTFLEFYGSKGWMVGKSKMVDWILALMKSMREWDTMHNTRKATPQEQAAQAAADKEADKRKFYDTMKRMGLDLEAIEEKRIAEERAREMTDEEALEAEYEEVKMPAHIGPKFDSYAGL